ncbi:MAG: class I SAM-dependent methyltransferase [Candidatus Aminicenantes bacterium]|jgi:ubiquinone/menaquinone biosynthesis C-methylase UbiE
MQFYLTGRIYDWFIEPLVRSIKGKVAFYFQNHDLFPALDICCGTGTQCQILGNKNPNVCGLDIDQSMVAYASLKYPQRKFICADAIRVPFKDRTFKGILISFSLHDKTSETQEKIMEEARRLLDPEGAIVFVDFENSWNIRSKVGSLFTFMIERIAGDEHFKNNRKFLKKGGLRAFIERHQLVEIERHNIELGVVSVVVAKPV